MNIYDISEKAGVSIATVSRVLNGKDTVSPKTREKVLAVMKEMSYTPNAFARGLGLNTMKTVGILCTDVSDLFIATAVSYLEREMRDNGYDSFLACSGFILANKKKALKLLLSKRVDAIILVGSQYRERNDNTHIAEASEQVPVMVVNGFFDIPNTYASLCDDYASVYDVTNRFISQGRKDILYVYDAETYSGMQKLSGYKNALSDAGIAINEDLIIHTQRDIDKVYEHVNEKIQSRLSFSAAVCSEDLFASGVIKALHTNNKNIPHEVSVIGYNNSLIARCCQPECTSVDNKLELQCINTTRMLIDIFEGRPAPLKTVISAELVERGTTLPFPSSNNQILEVRR
jgi:LacI family transcriptional regulator/LacI family asc operon transcriptional repressor